MNPYKTLGVPPDAEPRNIRQAYRSKARKLHPDAGGDEDAFTALALAHDLLIDPVRRQRYDDTGETSDRRDVDRRAVDILIRLLIENIQQAPDIRAADLLGDIRRSIHQRHDAQTKTIDDGNAAVAKIAEARRRLSFAKAESGPLHDVLDHQIEEIRHQIARCEDNLRVMDRALELSSEYSYKHEAISANIFSSASNIVFTTWQENPTT